MHSDVATELLECVKLNNNDNNNDNNKMIRKCSQSAHYAALSFLFSLPHIYVVQLKTTTAQIQ